VTNNSFIDELYASMILSVIYFQEISVKTMKWRIKKKGKVDNWQFIIF